MNVTSFSATGYARPAARAALRALRATGTTHVAFVYTWYLPGRTASTVVPEASKTPTAAAVLTAMRYARRLGLRTSVKPLVDVRDGSFRGEIAPRDRAAFFRSYAQLLGQAAVLASAGHAEALVVGTELKSLSGDEARWRDLIARARRTFGGRLTYGANWVDEAEQIRFWDALDEIGIDAYMPLTRAEDPPLDELVAAWKPFARRMAALSARRRRPVVLTELGYPSRLGAAIRPGAEGPGAVAQEPQARAYEAAFRALAGKPWLRGIWWWEWSAEGANARTTDGSYRPAGKLAERVLRRFNARPDPRAHANVHIHAPRARIGTFARGGRAGCPGGRSRPEPEAEGRSAGHAPGAPRPPGSGSATPSGR